MSEETPDMEQTPEATPTPGSTQPAEPAASSEVAARSEELAPTYDASQRQIVGERDGMFGVHGSGDTSGYGGLHHLTELPGATPPPLGGWMDEFAQAFQAALSEAGLADVIEKTVAHRKELTVYLRRDNLVEVMRILRDNPALRFELCVSVSGVHFPEETNRELHVVYHLLSMTHNRRVRLEVAVPDADPHIPSVVSVYPTADWHERETYDFFGVIFDGHPALTRIQMPDDWPGHPQRKDYPLGGIPVEYKGGTIPPPDQRRSYS